MNPQLHRSIVSGVWGLEENTRIGLLPIAVRYLKGERIHLYEGGEDQFKPYAVNVAKHRRYSGFDRADANSVAVIPIHGTITKADQDCGPDGTVSLMRKLEKADRSENIIATVLDFDSGGGEATNIVSVANFISNLDKPVFSWYNGLLASAAYGIAIGTNGIYAAQSTDIVGSIGVFTTFWNWSNYFKSAGIEVTDVYSDLSSEKNEVYLEAVKGNFEPLKKKMLNPFAEAFHASVRQHRAAVDDKALKGGTYMTKQAKKMGLIDGEKTWEEMLQHAHKEGKKHRKKTKGNQSTTNMSFKKFKAFFGFEPTKGEDGGVVISAEDMKSVEQKMEQVEQLATLEQRMEQGEKDLKAANDKILELEKLTARVEELEKGLKLLGDMSPAPASNPVVTSKKGDNDGWNNDEGAETEWSKGVNNLFGK